VGDLSVPICIDGLRSIPGLPEYGGPAATSAFEGKPEHPRAIR
jgi:hypothetical protein